MLIRVRSPRQILELLRNLQARWDLTYVIISHSLPVVAQLATRGIRHLYIDGGITIQGFLRAGAIQRLIITRVPVLIGDGVSLFGSLPCDIRLHHVATRGYESGLVQSEYLVLPSKPSLASNA